MKRTYLNSCICLRIAVGLVGLLLAGFMGCFLAAHIVLGNIVYGFLKGGAQLLLKVIKEMVINQESGLGIYLGIYCFFFLQQLQQQAVLRVHAAVLC